MIGRILILTLLIFCSFSSYTTDNIPKVFPDKTSPAIRNINSFNYKKIIGNEILSDNNNIEEDFNLPELRNTWISKGDICNWSLIERPGYLRIISQQNLENKKFDADNTFSLKILFNTSSEVTFCIDHINLNKNGESGLFFSDKEINYIVVKESKSSKRIQSVINGKIFEGPKIKDSKVMFRALINFNTARLEYSIDGLNFIKIGEEFQISTIPSKENLVGLFCRNNKNIRGYVDVDWLYIRHNHEVNLQLADGLINRMVNKL